MSVHVRNRVQCFGWVSILLNSSLWSFQIYFIYSRWQLVSYVLLQLKLFPKICVYQVCLTWVTWIFLRTAAGVPSIYHLFHVIFCSGQQGNTGAFVLEIFTGRRGSESPHATRLLGHYLYWRHKKRQNKACDLSRCWISSSTWPQTRFVIDSSIITRLIY